MFPHGDHGHPVKAQDTTPLRRGSTKKETTQHWCCPPRRRPTHHGRERGPPTRHARHFAAPSGSRAAKVKGPCTSTRARRRRDITSRTACPRAPGGPSVSDRRVAGHVAGARARGPAAWPRHAASRGGEDGDELEEPDGREQDDGGAAEDEGPERVAPLGRVARRDAREPPREDPDRVGREGDGGGREERRVGRGAPASPRGRRTRGTRSRVRRGEAERAERGEDDGGVEPVDEGPLGGEVELGLDLLAREQRLHLAEERRP
mmetsp:Transcript_21937/g.87076  ORF Transcript_21937/g.87076 Transcript_21937/m.87076 type:complete len:262 (+) Transcript_21937:35-820(+)